MKFIKLDLNIYLLTQLIMKGIMVNKTHAETARNILVEFNSIDKEKKIKHQNNFVIFPVKNIENSALEKLNKKNIEFKILEEEFENFAKLPSLAEATKKFGIKMRSFDIIGDIAVIEFPEEAKAHEKEIADSLLSSHKNIKAVFKKASAISGEGRVRKFEHAAGENRTITLYREHGCIFRLDIAKVYFSPRLSHERKRILEQVKDREAIVDMFAGIGSFSIVIARHKNVKIYAIDINRHAYEYLKENIMLNKVSEKINPLLGDCREICKTKGLKNIADRIIMNLPMSAEKFFDVALDAIKESGGIINYYTIAQEEELPQKIKTIEKTAQQKRKKVEIISTRIVKPYSPSEYHFAVDIYAKKAF